jgi:uncharacterized protein YlaI
MPSRLNTEYDSRILTVSLGAGGMVTPQFSKDGQLERVHCLNCGKPGGYVTAELPVALRNDPGVIYVCADCDGRLGALPAHAISFDHRKD